MHLEDLQLLVIGHADRDEVDAVLWDPMPGGSGLLQQLLANFPRVTEAAVELARSCPSACAHSCVDCLQTFRNGFYHAHLDRHVALEKLEVWGSTLREEHGIPSTHPAATNPPSDQQPVNDGEIKLKRLLEAAGFLAGRFQQQVRFKKPLVLDHLIGSTTPDVFYSGDTDDPDDKGLCVYLDGLSSALHGDPATASRDHEIRAWLRNNGYQVVEISRVDLDDRNAMVRQFKRIARYLEGRSLAESVENDTSWFEQR